MTSSAPNAYQQQSPTTSRGDRPLSFYDNLSNSSAGGRIIQFPDIQFRFNENIPDRRSVHSSAKSDFFGLSHAPATGPLTLATNMADEADQLAGGAPVHSPHNPNRSYDNGAGGIAGASASSPTSSGGSSTAPMHSPSVSPSSATEMATSTPRCSRPNSTIKTITIKLPDASCPSEAVYMTTTVPQNFTKNANTLIVRHKPTRSSLRHSRMLVVNKTVPVRYPPGNSLNLHHLRLCRTLMILLILIGLVLNVIGLAIMVWSPSTNTKDNPYWSGLILILCGVLFLVLFQFKRGRNGTDKGVPKVSRMHQPQSAWQENCFYFLRVNALIVLLLTIFFTMLAFIYALIHATNLSDEGLRCEPQFTFNVNSSTCVCTIDMRSVRTTASPRTANVTDPSDEVGLNNSLFLPGSSPFSLMNGGVFRAPEGVIRLEYRDFNCNEVHSIWFYVMIASTLLNSLGCLLAIMFLVIYSIECMLGSDRQPHRVKNRETGERMVENAITSANNPIAHQQSPTNITQDASTLPLLTVVTQTSRVTENTNANSASTKSNKQHEPGYTDTTVGENTITTLLSDEDDTVLMS